MILWLHAFQYKFKDIVVETRMPNWTQIGEDQQIVEISKEGEDVVVEEKKE